MLLTLSLWLLFDAATSAAAGLELKPKPQASIQTITLRAAEMWSLEMPPGMSRFDASALLRLPDGTLLTLEDKSPGFFQIAFSNRVARLLPFAAEFNAASAARTNAAWGRREFNFDFEGLARDEAGRLYLCDEAERWVLRFDPASRATERLMIDWQPARRWFSADRNASWEGIAVGGGKLYLANERSTGRIVVVDLATLKVERDFQAAPPGVNAADIHYSDLCWHAGHLWILCRESRRVLQVDATAEKVLAAFDYEAIERDPQNAYAHPYPYGFVEGLWVDDADIWLLVDNNGFPRVADKGDRRPQLWKCPRPDQDGEKLKAQSSKLK